jgi:hypothetical protein
MTNAERQRRYRDKKRGGPPVGRWPDGAYMPKVLGDIRGTTGWGKSQWYMAKWICDHFPEVLKTLGSGRDARESVSHAYHRLKGEAVAKLIAALMEEPHPETAPQDCAGCADAGTVDT